MALMQSSEVTTTDISSEQTKRYYENLDKSEKTLTERIKENKYMLEVFQKRIEEDCVTLKRIQEDRESIANAEKMTRESILERNNNLKKLASESLEALQNCYQLPKLIAIEDAKVQELKSIIQTFEGKLNDISSFLNNKHEQIMEHTIDTFTTSISDTFKSIEEILDEKISNLLDGMDILMEKSESVESFTKFVRHIKEVLVHQIIEKNVKAKHVGDTPVRQSTSYPKRIKEVAPREALIEKFKQSSLQKMEESEIDD